MESRERIGLYGSGEVPRSRRLWSKSPGPEGLGLKDIRQLPPMKRVRPLNKRKTVATSLVTAIISLAAVFVVVSALALAPSGPKENAPTSQQAPITPYPVIGIVFDNTGQPVGGASINITNVNTGKFNNTLISDSTPGSVGYYIFDLNTLGAAGGPVNVGDVITIAANDTTMMGTNTTSVPTVFVGFIWFNVTLNQTITIPEFPVMALPVIGMLGSVLAMVLVARVRDE